MINSGKHSPDFGSAVPSGDDSAPQPTVQSPQSSEEERNLLWRTIYGLATNFDTFTSRQSREYEDNRFAMLQAIVQELSHLRSTNAPRIHEPRMFNGASAKSRTPSLSNGDLSLRTTTNVFTYLGFYLCDGSPTAWYTSIEKTARMSCKIMPLFSAPSRNISRTAVGTPLLWLIFVNSSRHPDPLSTTTPLASASSPGSCQCQVELTHQTAIQMYYHLTTTASRTMFMSKMRSPSPQSKTRLLVSTTT